MHLSHATSPPEPAPGRYFLRPRLCSRRTPVRPSRGGALFDDIAAGGSPTEIGAIGKRYNNKRTARLSVDMETRVMRLSLLTIPSKQQITSNTYRPERDRLGQMCGAGP
jgi:hypothetical protein